MSDRISVVQAVAGLHPRYGGPSRTVVQLSDALAMHPDIDVTLLSQGYRAEPTVASTAQSVDRRVIETASAMGLKFALPIRRELDRIVEQRLPSLIHSHGLWHPANHWAARTARRYRIPLVLHPRGMVQATALRQKSLKKQIAMAVYQARDLRTVSVLIAASTSEYESIRALGCRQPVAVIPNGIVRYPSLPEERPRGDRRVRTVLFLSRIHPLKGLINLIKAWERLAPIDWRLQIAGPDYGGHLSEVMALAARLGTAESIDYLGEVDGAQKAAVFRNADLFVLPTFSENFGVVVVEALSHGLPVITTHGAPWADLETYKCGWWVEVGVEPLTNALRKAMSLSSEQRADMGQRGRKYAGRYGWEDIARRTAEVYRWTIYGGDMPPSLLLD